MLSVLTASDVLLSESSISLQAGSGGGGGRGGAGGCGKGGVRIVAWCIVASRKQFPQLI